MYHSDMQKCKITANRETAATFKSFHQEEQREVCLSPDDSRSYLERNKSLCRSVHLAESLK